MSYKNLTPGKEYTVKGVLMNKATGEPLLADGKEIRSFFTFKPDKPDGEINITFVFDASGLKTATEIVVFETPPPSPRRRAEARRPPPYGAGGGGPAAPPTTTGRSKTDHSARPQGLGVEAAQKVP